MNHSLLRKRAQARLRQKDFRPPEKPGQASDEIIHELHTYQAALEIQNEDLREMQVELEESRSRYVELYEHAPVGYFSFDRKGIITSVNLTGADMLQRARGELLKDSIYNYIPVQERDNLYLHLRKTFAGKTKQELDIPMQRNGSGTFYANLTSLPVLDKEGNVVELRTTVIDITERKKQEKEISKLNSELMRSNEDLLHFAFIVSHDLQEPLRTVSSFVQLVERRYDEMLDDKGHVFMHHIVEGTEHMQNLLQDLLSFSRIGGNKLARRNVSLEEILKQVEDVLARQIEENGAEIISGQLPVIYGDGIMLSTLLQNLIGNSLKYRSEAPPRIHVSAEPYKDKWVICVRDNGIGIDQQYAEQIFLIFQRLHQRGKYSGTGIGLAICKRIVERHGGDIWVESTPGKGAAFCFSLPQRQMELHDQAT